MSDNLDVIEQTSPTFVDEENLGDTSSPPEEAVVSPSPRYHAIFVNFMSYFHEKSTPYPQDHVFTSEDLLAITPDEICGYLNTKAFGKLNPEAQDKLASNWIGVDFIRKAIEHNLPQENNPARSSQVQNLMDRIRSMEKRESGGVPMLPRDSAAGVFKSENMLLELNNTDTNQMLRKMHDRNVQYINIIQTMDSTIRTLTKTVQQMKRTLESHNLQIQNEMIGLNGAAETGVVSLPMMDQTTLISKLKEEEAGISAALNHFHENDQNLSATTNIRLGVDGYCTFYNESGKEMDLPEKFELPTCDLIDAWTAWLVGFPAHKFRVIKASEEGDVDTLVDAPIKPLRNMRLGSIPVSLKKKYKDGWRPILHYMEAEVEEILADVSTKDIDDAFVNATFSTAMGAMVVKVPGLFDGKNERSKTWKVATWSRKIREQMGNSRRSLEDNVQAANEEDTVDAVDVVMTEQV